MHRGRLISRYPVLYHMAEDGSWESIRKLGLLSTGALLDTFEVEDARRFEIESCHRPKCSRSGTPNAGALVRDNKPMREKVLAQCLVGMEPTAWYETLNRRVFFWVDRKRLVRLLGAQGQTTPRTRVRDRALDTAPRGAGLALAHQLGRDLRHEPGPAWSYCALQ
jgi:hypothetical protein